MRSSSESSVFLIAVDVAACREGAQGGPRPGKPQHVLREIAERVDRQLVVAEVLALMGLLDLPPHHIDDVLHPLRVWHGCEAWPATALAAGPRRLSLRHAEFLPGIDAVDPPLVESINIGDAFQL